MGDTRTFPDGTPFALGDVVHTPGAAEAILRTYREAGHYSPMETECRLLSRHQAGDWGNIDPEDAARNDWALLNDARLMSSYELVDGTTIWVITEDDRSVTTFLLPEDSL